MKFDFCIGNPPYNDEQGIGDQKNFAKPVYHTFIESAYRISDKVELIHPARFLYNAGATPKEWNEKMLKDPHFKILKYEADSRDIFGPNVSITGGIAITYHDDTRLFEAVNTFTAFPVLNRIINKVTNSEDFVSLDNIIFIQTRLDLDNLYSDHPEYENKCGRDNRLERNIFDKIDCFTTSQLHDSDIRIIGMEERKRKWKYIDSKYILSNHENLYKWKVLMSTSNGGAGNICSSPVSICGEPYICEPGEGYTRTFVGIGQFDTKKEAENLSKYIKTRFCRCMLGVLKATQLMNKEVWHMIPIQDFTDKSNIDWSQSVNKIDVQLNNKYHLDDEEIQFIVEHIKEME